MSIVPINTHVLIEPLKSEDFVQTQDGTFEEIGVVVDFDTRITDSYTPIGSTPPPTPILAKGVRVYFDSWCAAKYPKPDGEYYWLVKYEDIRAVEHVIEPLPQE